jgi:hypothetical protein
MSLRIAGHPAANVGPTRGRPLRVGRKLTISLAIRREFACVRLADSDELLSLRVVTFVVVGTRGLVRDDVVLG